MIAPREPRQAEAKPPSKIRVYALGIKSQMGIYTTACPIGVERALLALFGRQRLDYSTAELVAILGAGGANIPFRVEPKEAGLGRF
jgi:hypothetical protein